MEFVRSWGKKPTKLFGACDRYMVGYLNIDGNGWVGVSQHAWIVAKQPVVWLPSWRFSLLGRNLRGDGVRAGEVQLSLTVH